MTAERWARVVREQVSLGRLLPLGVARDGAWIAESAAETVLRGAADGVPGVRLGALRIALSDPDNGGTPAVPPPPSALPPGPLRLSADFAAHAAEPLPTTASRLRTALAAAATDGVGLTVTEVDLHVTGLWDEEPGPRDPGSERAPERNAPQPAQTGDDETRVAAAALAVPGVSRLTGTLGGLGRAVHIEDGPTPTPSLPRRHVRVELAVRSPHQPLKVTREVRTAVTASLPDTPTVTIVVTATD
ncbi:nucleopolyhedrovirus P10 family protein [Streptomyces sp. NPDC058739]|uniref:nucleopolyhedrovirus P10 family protein n=1 Tax=Streptomyces sp. NPDC058739 TaxID=3346618 RepID=UPI0036B3E464